MFAGLKQNHRVIREKDICPRCCDGADLRFQAHHQAECYLALSNGHHRPVNNKKFVKNFGPSWPVLEVVILAGHRKSFAGLPFIFHNS